MNARRTIGGALQDLRVTGRGLRRDWAFTATAIAVLALGLALNATAFTIVQAMVFRGLPHVHHSERVVYVGLRNASGQPLPISSATFQSWHSQTRTFDGLAFQTRVAAGPTTFAERDRRPVEIVAQRLSASAFSLLGVQPMLGRTFTSEDEAPGAPPVAIVSHRFWEAQLGKRPDVVGSRVLVNDVPAVIVGVMPREFVLVYEQDLWMPPLTDADTSGSVFGRLRDGVTLEEARAELETLQRRLPAADPTTESDVAVEVETYSQAHVGRDAQRTYGWLWAAAWFVLLIVCANVANLLLARTLRAWRHFSMKVALGASRWRLLCQVFGESVLLAGASAAIAWWMTKWAVASWAAATASRYLTLDYTVDSTVLLYLAAIALAAALLCAMAPLSMVLRLGATGALTIEAGGLTRGVRARRFGRALVASQTALSIVLLSGTGLLVRSLMTIVNAETGVRDADNLVVGSLMLPIDRSATAKTRVAYLDRLGAALQTTPGVTDVSVASHIPVNWVPSAPFELEGMPRHRDLDAAQVVSVGSHYFRVIGAPPTAGRDFNDADRPATPSVAIVNQRFVDRFLPGEQVLGRRLRLLARAQSDEWLTVVGIVPNVIQVPSGNDQTRQHFTPLVYVAFRQQPMVRAVSNAGQTFPGANVMLRIEAPFGDVGTAIRAAVRKTDPEARLETLMTLTDNTAFDRDRMDSSHAELANNAMAGQALALVALVLAAMGLYAVMAHSVGQRTKEIGVRMAIGAAAADVCKMVVSEGMRPAVAGMLAGCAASLGVNRVLQSQLVGVTPYDMTTMASALLLFGAIALLACGIPARWAASVDPSVALRRE